MKTGSFLLAALVFSVVSISAQDDTERINPDARNTMQFRSARKGAELLSATPARPPTRLQEPIIRYEGFVVEWLRAPSPKRAMLDLRQPIRHDEESPNLFRDPATGRARGFVLFAIRF